MEGEELYRGREVQKDNRTYRGEVTMSLLDDVEKLKQSPLPEVRVALANRISGYFNESVFDKFENKLACEILRLLARDVEIKVRKAISENLKTNSGIPHDIALGLAQDVLEVALPMLEYSQVLTDEDLISIVDSTAELARLRAVARREGVSEPVSAALVKTKQEPVMETLLENKTAHISEASLQEVINDFRDNGKVIEKLVFRGDLPVAVVERMMSFVAENLKDTLIKEYRVQKEVAEDVVEKASEQATLGILEQTMRGEERDESKLGGKGAGLSDAPALEEVFEPAKFKKTKELVDHLRQHHKLTSSIILRALCEGNLAFFEVGLARLSGVPIMNAHTLTWASNPSAFYSLYKRAKMPMSTFAAVEIVLLFVKQEHDFGAISSSGFKQRIVERLMNGGYDRSIPLMPYLITLINSKLTTSDVLN